MKKKTFLILLTAVIAVCVLLTAAHIFYVLSSYPNSSIIHFIAKELW